MSRYAVAEDSAPISLPTVRSRPSDPPAELGRLRDREPLWRLRFTDGHVGWLVADHENARAVLADRRFSIRGTPRSAVAHPLKGSAFLDAVDTLQAGILGDPPQHTRLRRVLTDPFSKRRIGEHRPWIERIVAGRLDAMSNAGPVLDLVSVFAVPVPSLSICQLLGVAHTDRNEFEVPTAMLMDSATDPEQLAAAFRGFRNYAQHVIQYKRANPGDDLLSELIHTGEPTDDELAGTALMLFMAGHDTTAGTIALSTFALLCQRERWEALRDDPSLINDAVDELMRYLTIVEGSFIRTALADVQLGDVLIEQGQSVLVSLAAANRNPHKFADPDTLDVQRKARGHIAFGHGIHICLGQHLARLEVEVALGALMQRFPTLRLAVPAERAPGRARHAQGCGRSHDNRDRSPATDPALGRPCRDDS